MALYTPDYKYEKAKKVIDKLGDTENEQLIKYFIEKQKERNEFLRKRITEYDEFFRTLKSFLPSSGTNRILG